MAHRSSEMQELAGRAADAFNDTFKDGFSKLAYAIHQLGNGDASTPMGGLEAHSVQTKEGLDNIAEALREVAGAIETLALAVRDKGTDNGR